MSSQQRRLIRNASFSSGSYLVVVLVALVTTPYMVAKLSLEGYGIFIVITSIVGYYGLIDFGLGQGVTKFVSEYRARGESELVYRSINAAIWIQVTAGLVASALIFALAQPLLEFLKVSGGVMDQALPGLRVSTLGFFFTMITGAFSATMMGLQRFDISGKIDAFLNVGQNILIVFVLWWGWGLLAVIVCTVVTGIIGSVAYYIAVRRLLPELRLFMHVEGRFFRRILGYSVFMFVAKLANVFSTYFSRFVISATLGPSAVTLFVVPAKMISAFGGLLSSATSTLFPFSSELGAQKKDIRGLLSRSSLLFAGISIPMLLGMALTSREILALWMGHAFAAKTWVVLTILAFSGLVASQSTVPNQIVSGLGHSKLLGLFGGLAVVSYTAILPVATSLWGVTGAATGMLITTLINVAVVFVMTTRALRVSGKSYLWNTFRLHLIPVILCPILWFMLFPSGDDPSWLRGGLGVLLVLLYYVFLLRVGVFHDINPRLLGGLHKTAS